MSTTNAVNLTDSASADFEFPSPGSPGYDEFRKTGKLPSVEDSAPPKEDKQEAIAEVEVEEQEAEREIESLEEEDPASSAAVTPADSAPAPRRKANAEQRKNQLQEEIREAARILKELKEEAEKVRKPASQSATVEPEKKPDAEPEPDLGGINAKTGRAFATIAEWQKEHSDWMRKQLLAEVEGRFKTSDEQRRAAEQEKFLNEGLQQKFQPGVEKYPDFKEVVGNPKLFLPRGSAADLFIRNSDNAAEMAYYLGKHPEILTKFYRDPTGKNGMEGAWENILHPGLQMIELAKIELQITGQNAPPKPPARTITQAPRPPHRVSGQAPTADPLAKAVEEGDQAAYTRLENERQLARMRESRGRRKG